MCFSRLKVPSVKYLSMFHKVSITVRVWGLGPGKGPIFRYTRLQKWRETNKIILRKMKICGINRPRGDQRIKGIWCKNKIKDSLFFLSTVFFFFFFFFSPRRLFHPGVARHMSSQIYALGKCYGSFSLSIFNPHNLLPHHL